VNESRIALSIARRAGFVKRYELSFNRPDGVLAYIYRVFLSTKTKTKRIQICCDVMMLAAF